MATEYYGADANESRETGSATEAYRTYMQDTAVSITSAVSDRKAMHLGMFEGDEPRQVATTLTKTYLASRLKVQTTDIVLDLGSGNGDAARFLVRRFGCRVIGLNLIHYQNLRALELNRETGLDSQVAVVEGDFANVPLPICCAQVVWSQDAWLFSSDKSQVVLEATRLLNSGGTLIFTDILQVGPMKQKRHA